MEVGIFFGQTLTVASVTSILTQILKIADSVHPYVREIPFIGNALSWLIETITPEDPAAIRIFVALVCFAMNALFNFQTNGVASFDVQVLFQTLTSFFMATGAYDVILSKFNKVQAA